MIRWTQIVKILFLLVTSFVAAFYPHSRVSFSVLKFGDVSIPQDKSSRVFYGSLVPFSLVSSRVQKIKDVILQRDILKDITASEFALRLEVKKDSNSIDYDKLILKLDENIFLLRKRDNDDNRDLINRIVKTRDELIDAKKDLPVRNIQISTKVLEAIKVDMSVPSINSTRVKDLQESLRLIVREDGTVDWDGAVASGKEVAKFGTELWERLNGKEEEAPSFRELFGQMEAKVIETEEIQQLAKVVSLAQISVDEVASMRDTLRARLQKMKKQGQAIVADDVKYLRRLDLQTKEREKRLKLVTLDLDMERICVYLQQEIESSLDPSDQRRFVAEVALVDKQLASLISGLDLSVNTAIGDVGREGDNDGDVNAYFISLVDDDELNLISGEVADLKGRLGIAGSPGISMDWGSLGKVVSENTIKLKEGLSFFSEGFRMLLSDVQYAWLLLARAAGGYTLKPREVNAVRRTGKDMLVLIPFAIIFIIPLTPVGHVLVYSLIQRFFPDFFPTPFTEKRRNLKRMFAEIERRDEDDIIGTDTSWGLSLPSIDWKPFSGFLPFVSTLADEQTTQEK